MLAIIEAGGWLVVPILAFSVLSSALILDRLFMLKRAKVVPPGLVDRVIAWDRQGVLDDRHVAELDAGSPLGRILASGLRNRSHSREVIKEAIEDTGRHEAHHLERYLDTLGTIAMITPLLGLLGTVIGMIKVFDAIVLHGVGDPTVLAEGISEALLTTAFGLAVAIPTVVFHRYFRGRVNALVVFMEQEAIKLVKILAGERRREPVESATQPDPETAVPETSSLKDAPAYGESGDTKD